MSEKLDDLFDSLMSQIDMDAHAPGVDPATTTLLTLDMEELEDIKERGYKFGTSWESWDALAELTDALANGEDTPPAVTLWFVAAMSRMDKQDPRELVRQLGLVEMGRARLVNKFQISKKMVELVDGEGLTKADAARRCAVEFGCSTSTALHWYAKRDEVLNN